MTDVATDTALTLTRDYRPGALAEVLALHMRYYAPTWGLGRPFESKVSEDLGVFFGRFDPDRDLFLCAYDAEGRMQASITIDGLEGGSSGGPAGGAHLRWFIVSDAARGSGLGRRMVEQAVAFCRGRGYARVFLATFAGLDAARHLYESLGFVLLHEIAEDHWNSGVTEQHFALELRPDTRVGAA